MNAFEEKQILHQLASDEFDADELIALVSAIEFRQRDNLIYELLVPLTTGGTIIVTERAFKPALAYVKKLWAKVFARSAVAAPLNAAAPSHPAAAVAAAAVDVALLMDVCLSISLDVYDLYSQFPTENEATQFLPAEQVVAAQALHALGQGTAVDMVRISEEDVALTTAYVVHCSALPADHPRKLKAIQALFIANQYGYVPSVYLPLVRAARKLKPYTGGDSAAIEQRMEQCLGLYAKYGGRKIFASGRKAIRFTKWAVTAYNAYVVAQANVKMAMRYVPEGALPYVVDMSLEFLASPSSFDLQLPFKAKSDSALVEVHQFNTAPLFEGSDQVFMRAAPAADNANSWIQAADSTAQQGADWINSFGLTR